MKVAFVLINVESGKVGEVIEELKRINEVTEVYSIAGEYDIIIKISFSDVKKLGEIIPGKIQKISGIEKTNTLLTFGVHKYTRYEPCEKAEKFEEKGMGVELYNLCKSCSRLEECIYGQDVIQRGIEPTPLFKKED